MKKPWLATLLAAGSAAQIGCNTLSRQASSPVAVSTDPNDVVINKIIHKAPLTGDDLTKLNDYCESPPQSEWRQDELGKFNNEPAGQLSIRSCDGKYRGFITKVNDEKIVAVYSTDKKGKCQRAGVYIPEGLELRSPQDRDAGITNEEAAYRLTDATAKSQLERQTQKFR